MAIGDLERGLEDAEYQLFAERKGNAQLRLKIDALTASLRRMEAERDALRETLWSIRELADKG